MMVLAKARGLLAARAEQLLRWIAGPGVTIRFPLDSGSTRVQRFARPLDVILSHDDVLMSTLAIPRLPPRDAERLVNLHIENELPFAPDELVLFSETSRTDGSDEARVELVIASRLSLGNALNAAGLNGRAIRSLGTTQMNWSQRRRMARAWAPRDWRHARVVAAAPFIVLCAAGLLAWQSFEVARSQEIETLRHAVAQEQTATDRLVRALGEDANGASELIAMFGIGSVPWSVFSLLNEIRRIRPASLEVTELDYGGGKLNLAVRSDDVMRDMAVLGTMRGTFELGLEGAIRSDADGKEAARLALTAAGQ